MALKRGPDQEPFPDELVHLGEGFTRVPDHGRDRLFPHGVDGGDTQKIFSKISGMSKGITFIADEIFTGKAGLGKNMEGFINNGFVRGDGPVFSRGTGRDTEIADRGLEKRQKRGCVPELF